MSTTPHARKQVARIAGLVAGHVAFLKETGVRVLPVRPETVKEIAAMPAPKPRVVVRSAPAPIPRPPGKPVSIPVPPAPADVPAALAAIAERVKNCRNCGLCKSRTRTVPGQGAVATPEIAFVGEGPGADEDASGLAFVGRAGQLLTRMIEAMGFTREQVWIGNIVKCRPPGNRVPEPEEMAACLPFLREQLMLIRPRLIVCLGATAVKGLLNTTTGISQLRGTWRAYEGIPVMPTFHPAYLLRNPASKKDVWADLQAVLARLGRTPPPRSAAGDS